MLRNDEQLERGRALLAKIHGGHAGEALVKAQEGVCPDFAACTTLGFAAPQLRAHVEGALALGATKDEIVETILQTLFYAGGAAVANALGIAKAAFEEAPGV